MKKTLALFLAILFVFGSFGGAFAGSVAEQGKTETSETLKATYSGHCGANLTWMLDTETGLLQISGTGDMYDTWTWSNNAPWYSYRENIFNVMISSGVTSIGTCAFYQCTSLISVTIPEGITRINSLAFDSCSSLTSVIIPDNVTRLGNNVFDGCTSLTSVTIGSGVTSIGYGTFYGCTSLTSLTIPDSVESIGKIVFANCSSLTAINVSAGNQVYSSLDGVLFNKDRSMLICCPGGKVGTYSIPNSVTSIGESAFHSCRLLNSVTIPDSVTSIGESAFYRCHLLTSVTIPDRVTSIDKYAFYDCTSLTSAVFLGATPSTFGTSVFKYCASDFCIYYTVEHVSEWAPNGETTWNDYPIRLLGEEPAYGDVDCNGEVTMADVTLLAMYLNGENPEISAQGMINANANLDGGVDIRDIAAIYEIISNS